MNFYEYQKKAKRTAIYPYAGNNISYVALGLAGEAGEIANKVKKIIRDHEGELTDEYRKIIAKELGDVLWYVAAMSDEIGISLNEIAEDNILKLLSRFERGTLKGDGDTR